MPTDDQGRERPPSRLETQIDLLLSGIPDVVEGLEGAAVWPPDWREQGRVDYLYRERTALVRDADVERVRAIVPSVPVEHDNNLRGLTRLEFADDETRNIEEVCAAVDRALGEGVLTPDHIFYVCPGGVCPATEPEEVPAGAPPDPGVSTEPCDGRGVRVAVLDSGWQEDAANQHYWLAGVDGDPEDPFSGSPPASRPTRATGPLWPAACGPWRRRPTCGCAGPSRRWARSTSLIWSSRYPQVLRTGVDIISLDFGSNTRSDIASLGFDVVGEQLRNYPGVALVAAAGNDASTLPFWPAAFGWAVGVGALSANWRSRAYFSNYGPWVDVYAPGEGLVNAFATGQYICDEWPNTGQVRNFAGMARWSGTSFATPIVSGLIAARMSDTGESASQAAAVLLAQAQAQSMPGVGPVIFPGQACGDRHDSHQRGHGCGCSAHCCCCHR